MALDYKKIGKRIGEIRKRRGLSQSTLAEIIEKTPSYISYIENGVKKMSLETLVSIANALRVSADDLLRDCIENSVKVSNHEFAGLLSDCTEYEKRVLLGVSVAAKTVLRENRHFFVRHREV